MRTLIQVSMALSFIGAGLALLRLGMKAEWPVVLKYERWEYVMKVLFGAAWRFLVLVCAPQVKVREE